MILVQCSRSTMASTGLDGKWQVHRPTNVSIEKNFRHSVVSICLNCICYAKMRRTIPIFSEFMDENLTISNSAAGVLAHLAADDPESWTTENPSRETVKSRLRDTVNNWELESRRNVRYRYRLEVILYIQILFCVWVFCQNSKWVQKKFSWWCRKQFVWHLLMGPWK